MTREDAFESLRAEMTDLEVRKLIGNPDIATESTVPEGSGFGMQSAFQIKIRQGDVILQWVYLCENVDLVIWFARKLNTWVLSCWKWQSKKRPVWQPKSRPVDPGVTWGRRGVRVCGFPTYKDVLGEPHGTQNGRQRTNSTTG